MSIFHNLLKEVQRRKDETGEIPTVIRIHPWTKKSMEDELRHRKSFDLAYTSKTAGDMVINKLIEIQTEGKYAGRPVPGGWEIPIKADENVPVGQFWVGVNGFTISPDRIGEKIPRNILKGLSLN
jgi:hypothetical protein